MSKGPVNTRYVNHEYYDQYYQQQMQMNYLNQAFKKYFYVLGEKYEYDTGKKVRPPVT